MHALNSKNLFAFGILEEAYNTYEETIEANKSANTAPFDPKVYKSRNEMISRAMNKPLNQFIKSNRFIFTSNAEKIHLNNKNILLFDGTTGISRAHSYIHGYPADFHLPSFNAFFNALEVVICLRMIQTGRFPDMPNAYVTNERITTAIERMDERINRLANVYRTQLFQPTPCSLSEEIIPPEFIIFKSLRSLSCNINNHKIIPDSKPVWIVGKNMYVSIPIHKCCTCGRTFIGEQTLKQFIPEYGLPFFSHKYDGSYPPDYSLFKQSKLYSFLYNVQFDGMSKEDRQGLLELLYKTKSMTYFEIARDLNDDINQFERNPEFYGAVKRWKEDLKYISDLVESDLKKGIVIT